MSKISLSHNITISAKIELNESELRALDALIGYGTDPFLKVFYKHMGKHYLEPYENGLRALFKNIGETVRPPLARIDKARRLLKNEKL
jgi:hypothetical protein